MKKGVTKLYPYPGRQGRERSLVKKVAFSSTPAMTVRLLTMKLDPNVVFFS